MREADPWQKREPEHTEEDVLRVIEAAEVYEDDPPWIGVEFFGHGRKSNGFYPGT